MFKSRRTHQSKIMTNQQTKCGKKNSYASRAEAYRVLFIQLKHTTGLRVYHCPDCGKWHLTSKPLKETE